MRRIMPVCTLFVGLVAELIAASPSFAADVIDLLPSPSAMTALADGALYSELAERFDLSAYRQVRVQVIGKRGDASHHLLVYLHAQHQHSVDLAAIPLDDQDHMLVTEYPHALTAEDWAAQPAVAVQCPDPSVEFIAFAPNNDSLEQSVTKDVAATASQSLHTVQLLRGDATRQNYLNYMSCPKLRGNFYDGDANPSLITTVDGFVSAQDFRALPSGVFRGQVTNIWLACQAYNDPILSAVTSYDQSRKYAAGVSDLEIGPSDQTAACAMKAAIAGRPMAEAFATCRQTYDKAWDIWALVDQAAISFGTNQHRRRADSRKADVLHGRAVLLMGASRNNGCDKKQIIFVY